MIFRKFARSLRGSAEKIVRTWQLILHEKCRHKFATKYVIGVKLLFTDYFILATEFQRLYYLVFKNISIYCGTNLLFEDFSI